MKKIMPILLLVIIIALTGCSKDNDKLNSSVNQNNALDLVSKNLTINKDFSLVDEGTVLYDGKEYFSVSAGVSTNEKFTAENHYYVAKDFKVIYEYDVINDRITEVWKAK